MSHPITPPAELVQQWYQDGPEDYERGLIEYVATQAARWGADQELEACVKWVINTRAYDMTPRALRATRRPKPPSLAEQALEALETEDDALPLRSFERSDRFELIRRALERLQELEKGND